MNLRGETLCGALINHEAVKRKGKGALETTERSTAPETPKPHASNSKIQGELRAPRSVAPHR